MEQLALWLWVVTSISAFTGEEPWLAPKLSGLVRQLSLSPDDIRARLDEVMWINSVHDPYGREVFNRLSPRHGRVVETSRVKWDFAWHPDR
jgi:hypothetical protein